MLDLKQIIKAPKKERQELMDQWLKQISFSNEEHQMALQVERNTWDQSVQQWRQEQGPRHHYQSLQRTHCTDINMSFSPTWCPMTAGREILGRRNLDQSSCDHLVDWESLVRQFGVDNKEFWSILENRTSNEL